MTSALVPFTSPSVEQLAERPPAPDHHPPTIHAICLDIDDTVIDFTGSARKALSALVGRDDLWPMWERVTAEHSARAIAGELDHDTMRRARTKAFLADLGTHLDDDAVAALEDRRRDQMRAAWRPFPDAAPCLDWLGAAGLKIAAVTNASAPHQRDRLAAVGLDRYFDAVISAGQTGTAKPDPAIFHAACTALDTTPEATLHVGDRLDVDAEGARAAGLHGVWLDRTGTGHADLPVIDTLADLPTLLVTEYRTPTVTSGSALPAPRA